MISTDSRLRAAGLALVLLTASSAPTALGDATFTVTSTASGSDASAGDGTCATSEGICTWNAVAQEVQGSPPGSYSILFQGVSEVPQQFFRSENGQTLTIRGPITITAADDSALEFTGFHGIHVDKVWLKGRGSIGAGFDPQDVGITYNADGSTSCSVTNSRITGMSRVFRFGIFERHPCQISDNILGVAPDGTVVGNERGILLRGSDSIINGNLFAAVATSWPLEVEGDGNAIFGNHVGIDASGEVLSNKAGFEIRGDFNRISDNTIALNENDGLTIRGDFNAAWGNRIGLDDLGRGGYGNDGHGVVVLGSSNCIGSQPGGLNCESSQAPNFVRNFIGGNNGDGIRIISGTDNGIFFNYIGTDIGGLLRRENKGNGISLRPNSSETLIHRGTISGSVGHGIEIDQSDLNVVEGAQVGTNALAGGQEPLGNGGYGIYLRESSENQIGTDTFEREDFPDVPDNLISANQMGGIHIEGRQGSDSAANAIRSNWIGLDGAGRSLPNGGNGITLQDDAGGTIIEWNVVSGNAGAGIRLTSTGEDSLTSGPDFTVIRTNYIGTSPPTQFGDISLFARGNGGAGIEIVDGSPTMNRSIVATRIGGVRLLPEPLDPRLANGNIIAGNGGFGVDLGFGAKLTDLHGNFIGVDREMNPLANGGGVRVRTGATSNEIGGPAEADRHFGNVISANFGFGILAEEKVTIQGNFVGTDEFGEVPLRPQRPHLPLANGLSGISLFLAHDTIVGGSEAGANIIAGNREHGVEIDATGDADVSYNTIGRPGSGVSVLGGNRLHGVLVRRGATRNRILFNRVFRNGRDGVHVTGPDSVGNLISENLYLFNGRIAIELTDGGNRELPPPTADTVDLNQIAGVTCSLCQLEIYSGSFVWRPDGEIFELAELANEAGLFVANGPFFGPSLACTAIDLSLNTSEFGCAPSDEWEYEGLVMEKHDVDVNGGALEAGDVLEYQIEIINGTQHSFQDVAGFDDLIDPIPSGTSYVPGSLRLEGNPNDDALDDGFGFEAANNEIVWNGDIPALGTASLSFRVTVGGGEAGTLIQSQASLSFAAATLPLATIESDDPDTLLLEDATVSVVPEPGAALGSAAALAALLVLRRRLRGRRRRARVCR